MSSASVPTPRRYQPLFAACAAAMSLCALPAPASAAGPPAVRVVIDDTPVPTLRAAVINDVLYFPLRALVGAMRGTLMVARPDLAIRRADGVTFVVRPGRREVWVGAVVTAVVEAPVLVVDGVTMAAAGAVEAIFDVLVVWNRDANTAAIVTRSAFQSAVPDGPPSRRRSVSPGSPPRAFVPEFHPSVDRPVVAAGVVGFALSSGGGSGLSVATRVSFTSHAADSALAGAVGIGGGPHGPAAAEGVVTWRRGPAMLSAGLLSISDSPLTLYEQGLVGLVYDRRFGSIHGRFFGGILTGSHATVYGTTFRLPPVGALLPQATVLYSPETSATIVRGRVDWRVGNGWSLFGEAAYGSSVAGSGTGWRIGTQYTSNRWAASIGYLALSPRFPALGNAAVFAGRHGPAVELAYTPSSRFLVLGSAAVLSGRAGGERRATYRVFVQYWMSPSWALLAEARSADHTDRGTRARHGTLQAALLFTSGRWNAALTVRRGFDEQMGIARADTTAVTFHGGHVLPNGRPVWMEVGRLIGDTRGWRAGVGARLPLLAGLDVTAQLRVESILYPSASQTRVLDVGIVRPLASGAEFWISAGMTMTSSSGKSAPAAPRLAIGYRQPFTIFGPPKTGRVVAEVFVDANGNGRRDPDESPVAGIVIRIDGQSAARTDPAGRAAVDGVREGLRHISIDESTIPVGLVAVSTEIGTRVAADGEAAVTFTLIPAAALRCVVFLDENANGTREAGEPGVPGVGVVLRPPDLRATTEIDGTLVFENLKPGIYTVALDPRLLPDAVKAGDITAMTAHLTAGATVTCALPVLPAKGVIRTFP